MRPLWIDLVQLALIAAGGAWALWNYQRFRRAQAKIGLEATARVAGDFGPGESIVFLRVRMTNASSVLVWCDEAVATLLDASARTADGRMQLVPFAQEDPLLPVYGSMSQDPHAVMAGRLFELDPHDSISLEPGEMVESEVAFIVVGQPPKPMAARVIIRGRHGRWGRRPYWWGTFRFVDPASDPAASRWAIGGSSKLQSGRSGDEAE